VLRYARIDGRDPARALRSLLIYASAPAGGRLAGRPQRQSRPHLTRTTCTVRVTSRPTNESVAVAPARTQRAAEPTRPARRTASPAPAAAPSAPTNSARTAAPRTGGRSQLQSLLASIEDQHPRS
jgi:hypothetical protein